MGEVSLTVKCDMEYRTVKIHEENQKVRMDLDSILTMVESYKNEHENLGKPYITYNPSLDFYKKRITGAVMFDQVNVFDLIKGCHFVSYDNESKTAILSFDNGTDNLIYDTIIGEMPEYDPVLMLRGIGRLSPKVVDEVTGKIELMFVYHRFIALDLVMVEAKEQEEKNGDNEEIGG